VSLAETQQIYNLLLEIDALLKNVEIKTKQLNNDLPRTQSTLDSFKQLERVTIRCLALTRRMGLPDDVNNAITTLMRLISIIRMVQISINMMQMATGPFGFIMGAAGLMTAAYSATDVFAGY
jgi:hypothetical protein